MRITIALLFALLLTAHGFGQCSTVAHGPAIALHLPPRTERGGGAQFVIPTLVHVHYPDGVTLLSPQQIQHVLDQADQDLRGQGADIGDVCSLFANDVGDLSVELRLAHMDENGHCTSGIDYDHYTLQPDITGYTQNTAHYLNIHVVLVPNSYSVIPYAGMPAGQNDDMVMLSLYDALHTRELAHEVGHWLGLFHTFGNTNTSGADCGDDGVDDTPVTRGSVVGTCDTTLSTCTPGVVENVDNLMDYSTCGKMFTQGQAALVQLVMTDASYPRHQFWAPSNLTATGVFDPSTCPMHAEFDHRTSTGCGAMQVTFTSLCTGQVPDQEHWSFPGGAPATSTDDGPLIAYAASGTYTAQLIACNGTLCDTVQHTFNITVNDPGSNGLPMASLPFSEGFENDFSFPEPNIAIADHGSPTFEVTAQTGYQSAHCVYVPGSTVLVQDTADLVIGNFDLTGTVNPGLTMRVAGTNYDTAWYRSLDVRMRDLCGYLQGSFLQTWGPPDYAGSNHAVHFVPTADDQWVELTAAFPPGSTGVASAEVVVRVRRPWLPHPPFVPEDIYIDDIHVLDLPVTGIAPPSRPPHMQVFPDPAVSTVHIRCDEKSAYVQVVDMTGRPMLAPQRMNGSMDLDVSAWPRGCYLVLLGTAAGRWQQRLLVQ